MMIRVDETNVTLMAKMAKSLWTDIDVDEYIYDMKCAFDEGKEITYLYQDEQGDYLGFIQLSLRHDYVEGSESSPVGYVEGIYVKDEHRRKGIARKLIEFAEEWSREQGCTELASDCELSNTLSIDFHKNSGFTEANRLVCFIKSL
ncbi:MAG: GNAT family N-acetyltransferase [Clostridia bacterium]|nr:GNAT family N-acetyltransferase [Clostridia bacterium]